MTAIYLEALERYQAMCDSGWNPRADVRSIASHYRLASVREREGRKL